MYFHFIVFVVFVCYLFTNAHFAHVCEFTFYFSQSSRCIVMHLSVIRSHENIFTISLNFIKILCLNFKDKMGSFINKMCDLCNRIFW